LEVTGVFFTLKREIVMQNRRRFLRDCSLAAAMAVLAPGVTLASPKALAITFPEHPCFDQFCQQINTVFTVRASGQPIHLMLIKATAFSMGCANLEVAANENFSLLFHGPSDLPLPQDTYEFSHPQLGLLSIFIVPAGQAAEKCRRYEAVFSRPAEATQFALQVARAPRRTMKC
jgi:hypothetical protein